MIVTIHQPNFLPWKPYFDKMAMADVFVLLGHCQWEKGGYQNRFALGNHWHTMHVAHGLQTIKSKLYVTPKNDWERIHLLLDDYDAQLKRFDDCISHSMYDTNAEIIKRTASALGIKTKIVDDWDTGLGSTDRLVAICRELGATHYLSGSSGRHYMDMKKFEAARIDVIFFTNENSTPILEHLHDNASAD